MSQFASLRQHHERQLNETQTNNKNEKEILAVLGGIDVVLSHYLSANNPCKIHMLSQSQVSDLHNIICHPKQISEIQANLTDKNAENLNYKINNTHNNGHEIVYRFHNSNTFIHLFLSHNIVHTIWRIIFNRYLLIAILSMFLMWILTYGASFFWGDLFLPVYHIYEATFYVFYFTYTCAVIMSSNRFAFRYVIQTFDFWIKLLLAFRITIFRLWFCFRSNTSSDCAHHNSDDAFLVFLGILWGITKLQTTIIVSIIDCIYVNRRVKLVFVFCMSVLLSFDALSSTLFSWRIEIDDSADKVSVLNRYEISLFAITASSTRLLAVFFWKVFFQLLLHKNNKDRAAVISYRPVLQWVVTDENNVIIIGNSNNQNRPVPTSSVAVNVAIGLDDFSGDMFGGGHVIHTAMDDDANRSSVSTESFHSAYADSIIINDNETKL